MSNATAAPAAAPAAEAVAAAVAAAEAAAVAAATRIEIQIVDFREWWKDTTPIEMDLDSKGTAAPMPGIATDGIATTTGDYLVHILHPAAPNDIHEVIFWATRHPLNPDLDGAYELFGIAFTNRNRAGNVGGSHVFVPQVIDRPLNLDPANPGLLTRTVTVRVDTTVLAANTSERYEFKLWVRRLSDGAIGIIDPEWENEA